MYKITNVYVRCVVYLRFKYSKTSVHCQHLFSKILTLLRGLAINPKGFKRNIKNKNRNISLKTSIVLKHHQL